MHVGYDSGCGVMAILKADLTPMMSQQNIAQLQAIQTVTVAGDAPSVAAMLEIRVLCCEGQRVLVPWHPLRVCCMDNYAGHIYRGSLEDECLWQSSRI